jgi:uncharacterized protein YpmB
VLVLDQNTLAKEGYTFLGWATNATATVATHTAGSTFNIYSNTVLYAVWQSENATVPYTVLYYLEGTTSAIAANKTATGILGTSVTETAPTLLGYTAVAPTTITATLNATNNKIIFYYTANTDIEYTVYYYRQGSTTQLANPKVVTNQTMGTPVTETALTISGYTAVAPTSVTITLNAANNVITFYYTTNSGGGNSGGGNSGGGSNSGSSGGSSNKPTPTVPPQGPQTEPKSTPTVTPPASGTEESEQVWALVNLILSIAGLILVIIVVIAALIQKKKKQKKNTAEQERAQKAKQKNTQNYPTTEQDNETKEKEQKKRRDLWLLASIILGIAGIVVFVLTENWSLPMAWVDRWTIVNAIIFVAQIITIVFIFKHVKKENNNADDDKKVTITTTLNSNKADQLIFP